MKDLPASKQLLEGQRAKSFVRQINCFTEFSNNYKTRQEIKAGDVFVLRHNFGCGSELSGPHFVVAVVNSPEKSPIVTVIPLKTFKASRRIHPASDLVIGKIPGLDSHTFAIAIINQIKSIDKCRLFDNEITNTIYNCEQGIINDYSQPIECKYKKHYRLTHNQIEAIREALFQYLYNGFINRINNN